MIETLKHPWWENACKVMIQYYASRGTATFMAGGRFEGLPFCWDANKHMYFKEVSFHIFVQSKRQFRLRWWRWSSCLKQSAIQNIWKDSVLDSVSLDLLIQATLEHGKPAANFRCFLVAIAPMWLGTVGPCFLSEVHVVDESLWLDRPRGRFIYVDWVKVQEYPLKTDSQPWLYLLM